MVNDSSQSKSNPSYSPIRKRNYVLHDQSYLVTEAPTTVLPYRWGTNDSFDFTEGKWQGGYTSSEADSDVVSLDDKNLSGRMADHYRNIIFVKDANLWLVFDEMENMSGGKNTYSQVWNFAGYLEENTSLRGYTEEQMVIDEENNIIKTADENGPNLNIIQVSDNDLNYKLYYGYKEEGKWGRGWTKGGKDQDMAGFTPSPDVYVNWEDNGVMGEKTKVLSILAPTKDTSDPVKEIKNLSEGEEIHYYIESANGVKINYYSSPEKKVYKEGKLEIMAKTLLLTEQDGKMKGVILDGEYLEMSGSVSKYNTYKNFIFEIGENGYLADTAEISIPETFGWVENKDGSYTPYYNERQKKEFEYIGEDKELKFHDIDGHWGKAAIETLADKKIIEKELVYYPDKAITRGDFVKMVVLALGKGETEYREVFTDASNVTSNIGYLLTAYDLGIIEGDDEGNVKATANITREQMTKIIVKAFDLKGSSELGFEDVADISDWAVKFVKSAYSAGAVKGTDENKFNPKGTFTRAEAAMVIYNLIK